MVDVVNSMMLLLVDVDDDLAVVPVFLLLPSISFLLFAKDFEKIWKGGRRRTDQMNTKEWCPCKTIFPLGYVEFLVG